MEWIINSKVNKTAAFLIEHLKIKNNGAYLLVVFGGMHL